MTPDGYASLRVSVEGSKLPPNNPPKEGPEVPLDAVTEKYIYYHQLGKLRMRIRELIERATK